MLGKMGGEGLGWMHRDHWHTCELCFMELQ